MVDALRVYLIWDPTFSLGQPMAECVAGNLSALGMVRDGVRLSVPVRVRCCAYDGSDGGSPRPIELEAAASNIIVVLNNHALQERAESGPWKRFFETLADAVRARGERDLVIPVALNPAAARLAAYPDRTQWIDLHDPPLTRDNTRVAAEKLTIHVLVAAIQTLLNRCQSNAAAVGDRRVPARPKLKIFLSYARSDGRAIVDMVQDVLARGRFRLQRFLDIFDLDHGQDWRSQFEDEIACSAFVALQTDSYASRPFCQWELLTAKAYRRPILIASFVRSREERTFPYAGNLPLRMFSPTADDMQRLVLEIMAELLRCVLWEEVSKRSCEASGIADAVRLPRPPELLDIHFLTRVGNRPPPGLRRKVMPLLSVRKTASLSRRGRALPALRLVYPDPPVGDDERRMLLQAAPQLEFWSLSELERWGGR